MNQATKLGWLFLYLTCILPMAAAEPSPEWIWASANREPNQAASIRKSFSIDRDLKQVSQATLSGIADFHDLSLHLNGRHLADIESYSAPFALDIAGKLQPGDNKLLLQCQSHDGPAAVFVWLKIEYRDGSTQQIVSDATWPARLVNSKTKTGSQAWSNAASFGKVRRELAGRVAQGTDITALDDYAQWKQALGSEKSAQPSSFFTAPGFQIELVRSAGDDESSWINLAFDPQGRIVIAREDKGLLRMTLSDDGNAVADVESINDTLLECRGLLFAFDALYVNANNSKGLYRLRDTNQDDQFDEVQLLHFSPGNVGHGRNNLTLGPDNYIYLIHGDSVDMPSTPVEGNAIQADGSDAEKSDLLDLTSPLREQRRGQNSREGHVIRTDKDGRHWEVVSAGLRNPYGIDFNTDGEMFTYDADAEFDMGSPWYRPTRVNHLVAGADYGWRGVTGTWPPYYPDHADNALSNLDIGKGSPTSVKFGTKSNFPGTYRDALYILDWAYGRIVAVHMAPRGASYLCRAETVLKGRPLNVTGLDFAPDGSMYIVTGGRKTQSGLYRIRYVGAKTEPAPPTPQQVARRQYGKTLRRLRHDLESLLNRQDPAIVDKAWPHLTHADPWIRYTARTLLEHQPLPSWQARALAEDNATAALGALMSLTRTGDAESLPKILARLAGISLKDLPASGKLASLHTYWLCLQQIENLDEAAKERAVAHLDAVYPDRSPRVNQTLSRLLVKLESADVVAKTIGLLRQATDQAEQLHYLTVLRDTRHGWTPRDRRVYFTALQDTRHYLSGQGMPGFLEKIRQSSIETLTEKEKTQLASLLEPPTANSFPPPASRPFVRKWTVAALAKSLAELDHPQDLENGKAMFVAAACSRCHRVGLEGNPVGPDLTSVRSRFSRQNVLEAIITPSKVIPENYRSVRIVTTDGKIHLGRIVPGGDYRSSKLRLAADAQAPEKITEIEKSTIEQQSPSPVSWMPEGLLDTLTQNDILDLLAYLEAGGKIRP